MLQWITFLNIITNMLALLHGFKLLMNNFYETKTFICEHLGLENRTLLIFAPTLGDRRKVRSRSLAQRKQKTLYIAPRHHHTPWKERTAWCERIFHESDHIKKHYVKIPDGTRNHLDTLSRARRLHRSGKRSSAWALCAEERQEKTHARHRHFWLA